MPRAEDVREVVRVEVCGEVGDPAVGEGEGVSWVLGCELGAGG